MTAITFNPAEMGAEISNFKRLCVAAENGATPFARKALAGLLTGAVTIDSLTIALLQAFGNPKTPKGKPLAKLSASGDHVPGFGAARKTVASVNGIFANSGLNEEIKATVTAFVLESEGAAKSLAALDKQVKALVAAHNEATGVSEASDGEASGEGEGEASEAPMNRPDLADMANKLALAIGAATDEEISAALDAFAALAPYIGVSLEVMREAA